MILLTKFGGAVALCGVTLVAACAPRPESSPDARQELATFVDTLHAIDSHAHPMAVVAAGAPADSDYDALPLDGLPPFELPLPLRPGNPAYREARAALGNEPTGEQLPAWVLDQLHIDVMLANRVAMGPGLASPRFRWVSFVDALMLPLDTRTEAARTPDTKPLYPLEAKLLRRYLRDLGVDRVPATLDHYRREVVTATLEKQHSGGAVAAKFEAAYLRALDFAKPDSNAAAAIYARYAGGGAPSRADYKVLQDYLAWYIAKEAGRLGMAVQIHSTNGFGASYSAAGAAPHLLETLFADAALRGTNFVVVHGGWPLVDETLVQLKKPNVYADISMMDQLADSAALSGALRKWLAAVPEKVMFGTDAFDGGAQQGWELVASVASHNARRGLSNALAAMIRDQEITQERAHELARMVLHDNAMRAYRLAP